LVKQSKNVGFPLLIKASAGGGGKGMRIVHKPEDVASEIESAKREAKASFGDDSVLLERYFGSVKHIEFQIFGDSQGNVVHLYERDCSVQRRYQKIIEVRVYFDF
jgi:3-methylcrotonyl-CoA carboxylase alpha subunit